MARPNTGNEKIDWYQALIGSLADAMEEALTDGRAWQKCWKSLWESGLPHNGKSGHQYHGINVWHLALQGYTDPRWYTYKQAASLGAQVRKGEKHTKILFWRFIRVYEDANGKEVKNPSRKRIKKDNLTFVEKFPVKSYYRVFNAEQIDGLPEMEVEDVDPGAKYLQAQLLLDILGIEPKHIKGGNVACYRPSDDTIRLPAPGQFDSIEHYWATAMHEVIHWTGHKSRLDRDLKGRFGSDAYAMEELVAELGSAFLCAHLGIEGELRHPEYLAAWVKRSGEDKYALYTAAKLAQQAVDFIIDGGVAEATESENDESEAAVAKAA